MTKTISIHSYRGGTGKSNFAANVAWWMARAGKNVGVLDTDLQSPGVHIPLGFDTKRVTHTLSDFLFGKCQIEEAAYDLSQGLDLVGNGDGRLVLLPSSMDVESITRIVADGYDVAKLNESLRRLGAELGLDVLVIDTHPGLGRATLLTTSISDLLLLLLRPDEQDFQGTAVLLEVAKRLSVPRTFLAANKVVSALTRDEMRAMVDEQFEAELIGCIPLSEEMAGVGSRSLFCRTHPDHPITLELRAIADRLIAELDA